MPASDETAGAPVEPLDFDEVADACADLTMLNFFPGDDGGRLAVVKLVARLCSTMAQVEWLVTRLTTLYNKWPGPAEVRAVFCKRYPPADGIDTRNTHTSEFFPDGNIPCETPEALPWPGLALPPGRVSASPALENEIRLLAAPKAMVPARRAVRTVELVPVNPSARVTAREVEQAEKELMSARSTSHQFEGGPGELADRCRRCWLSLNDPIHSDFVQAEAS